MADPVTRRSDDPARRSVRCGADPGGDGPSRRRRLRCGRLRGHLGEGGHRGGLLHRHRRRRRRLRPHDLASGDGGHPPRRATGGGGRGGGDRRHLPRLPRRAPGSEHRAAPRHLAPGPDPPAATPRLPVARAAVGPDRGQPSRPPRRRGGGRLRRLSRRPQPVRPPRAPRGGPRAPRRDRALDDGGARDQPGRGRHRHLRPQDRRPPLPPQPGGRRRGPRRQAPTSGCRPAPGPPVWPTDVWPSPSGSSPPPETLHHALGARDGGPPWVVVQHTATEGPGLLAGVLERAGMRRHASSGSTSATLSRRRPAPPVSWSWAAPWVSTTRPSTPGSRRSDAG